MSLIFRRIRGHIVPIKTGDSATPDTQAKARKVKKVLDTATAAAITGTSAGTGAYLGITTFQRSVSKTARRFDLHAKNISHKVRISSLADLKHVFKLQIRGVTLAARNAKLIRRAQYARKSAAGFHNLASSINRWKFPAAALAGAVVAGSYIAGRIAGNKDSSHE